MLTLDGHYISAANRSERFPTLHQVVLTLQKIEEDYKSKNLTVNNLTVNAIKTIRLVQGTVSPTYFMTAEQKRELGGPCGWVGCSGPGASFDKTPEKALNYHFTLTVSNANVEKVKAFLDEHKLECKVQPIVVKRVTTVTLEKEPWYNDVLAVVRKHNPEFDEERVTGGNSDYYDEERMCEWMCHLASKTEIKYDPDYQAIVLSPLMNEVVLDRLPHLVKLCLCV